MDRSSILENIGKTISSSMGNGVCYFYRGAYRIDIDGLFVAEIFWDKNNRIVYEFFVGRRRRSIVFCFDLDRGHEVIEYIVREIGITLLGYRLLDTFVGIDGTISLDRVVGFNGVQSLVIDVP